jgi:predicted nuclease of restriction endonuclease-like (RecB) superfamily
MTGSSVALPDDYARVLVELKQQVRSAQIRAHRLANSELIGLYWTIGRTILDRQSTQGWGAKVIDQLAEDLRAEFPEMTGLSRRNLHYMRGLAEAWPTLDVVQQAAAQLPWGHILVLLDKLPDRPARDWYAAAAAANGWSRAVLLNQIKADARSRTGAALTNFATQLPTPDADLARQLVKDPYVFDFLNLTPRVAERELEDALVANLQQFLLELGHGFAFVARQYRFTVAGDDFAIDLLFFNYVQNRFVVFELKVDKFSPAHAGQLGMYVSWVQQHLAEPAHRDTIGILVCADRNAAVVHYALASASAPMAVSTYTYDQLPDQERQVLPSDTDLSSIIEHPVVHGRQMSLAEAWTAVHHHPSPDPQP